MDRDEAAIAAESWRVVLFSVMPPRIAYLMLDELLSEFGHRIVGIVTSPGPKRRRSDAYLDVVAAARPGVDVIVSNHPERWAAMLAPLRPDLIVSIGFPWLIPSDVLALPRLGAINLHPARLPHHRGPAAVEWAFRNGDAEIGFTVHRLADGFDTGAILAQGGVPIAADDDIDTLMPKLGALIPGLVRTALERVARGEPGEPQDEAQASYDALFADDWRFIDWNRPARDIHNQVRSWTGIR
ncbi:MAG TPA: formyltransferase family protein, partial [Bauldia sp.]|nr:formyltransferase family protein [Bauldia sp.]